MKISNWCKKLSATMVAAGVLAPAASHAIDIPLGDPSFENYLVPSRGYAYAADPLGAYRPTGSSAYAEATLFTKRPAPRTGNQAMHGLFNYSAQETSAVFEAGRTYTFSLWAQNDELLNESNGVFLYIFDGNVAFSDANSLAGGLFTAINQRGAGMTAAHSQANWTPISISHTVLAGAPEIGHPVGVGFFARKDSAVDDAALSSVVPEPGSLIMVGLGGLSVLALRRRK